MEYWTPKGEGKAFELAPVMEPLAPYKDQLLVMSGIKASWNYIHAGASGSFLTGTPRGGRNEIEIIADVSIDQLLGRHFANETQLASLEVSMDTPANAGACTGNLSCAYLDTLAWASPTDSSDARRFLIREAPNVSSTEVEPPYLILNWPALLGK